MGSLRRVATSLRRVLNSAPLARPDTNSNTIAASSNLLLKLRYFSSHSESHDTHIDLSNEESRRRLFNRLLYRSKQRGFLELDLVLGNWVEENIHSMDEDRIKALTHVLDLENPDLWRWISGQEQPPESLSSNPVFSAVRERVMKNLDTHSAPETRATPGQPWVRGWDDIKKGRDGPITGNQ